MLDSFTDNKDVPCNARRKDPEAACRDPVGKIAVAGREDRATRQVVARVVDRTDCAPLQGFEEQHADAAAKPHTDEVSAFCGRGRERKTVKYSAQEYAPYLAGGQGLTNGVESLWSMLKRTHCEVDHQISPKHLQANVYISAGRQSIREKDMFAQIQLLRRG